MGGQTRSLRSWKWWWVFKTAINAVHGIGAISSMRIWFHRLSSRSFVFAALLSLDGIADIETNKRYRPIFGVYRSAITKALYGWDFLSLIHPNQKNSNVLS